VTDSFITFPASKFILNLTANVDNTAKFLSTGTMNIEVENPDDFMRVIQSFGTDPQVQQMLATLTALADRTDENGKIVDRVNAKFDQQGKIFINTKDVTSMFLPGTPQSSATEEKTLENLQNTEQAPTSDKGGEVPTGSAMPN
jgi:hypothetical protein